TLLTRELLSARLPGRPLVIVDIAVPRSVAEDARELAGLRYRSVDDLADESANVPASDIAIAAERCSREAVAFMREWRARGVAERLGSDVEIRVLRTAGDTSDRPIRELGDGVFVTAIEEALRAGDIDLAVHSLKDLPTEDPADLLIAAVPEREDPRDVLVTRSRRGLADLPHGAMVGTSSPRRAAFLRALRAD